VSGAGLLRSAAAASIRSLATEAVVKEEAATIAPTQYERFISDFIYRKYYAFTYFCGY
jgi:hypothetical protein